MVSHVGQRTATATWWSSTAVVATRDRPIGLYQLRQIVLILLKNATANQHQSRVKRVACVAYVAFAELCGRRDVLVRAVGLSVSASWLRAQDCANRKYIGLEVKNESVCPFLFELYNARVKAIIERLFPNLPNTSSNWVALLGNIQNQNPYTRRYC